MATAGSNYDREARRRRILARGSDRLALITGRVNSISSGTGHSDQSPFGSPQHEEKVSDSLLENHDSHNQFDQHNHSEDAVEPERLPDKILTSKSDNNESTEISRAVVLLNDNEESSQVSSSIQTPAQDSRLHQPRYQNLPTANQIFSALTASESIRICSSIAIAIVVLLSYTRFPFLGWGFFRSIICFRPLYLLLITNISIVVARVLLEKQGSGERQTSSVPSVGGDGLFEQVAKALESGLLMQKIFGALFMDCSLYIVVLVCGLSLARTLGW